MYAFAVRSIATFLGVGYLPLFPGTWASAAGIGLWLLAGRFAWPAPAVCAACVLAGFLCCGRAERLLGARDPKCIVIDEVSGMLLGLLFLPAYGPKTLAMAFLFFRIFDTVKVFPADRIERLHGSRGVMGDDLVAGFYTNLMLQALLRLLPQ